MSRISKLENVYDELLKEQSLSRIWQHVDRLDQQFAIITAFRGEYTLEENIERNKSLANDIRKLGYGYFFVDGYYVENQGTPNEIRVKEDSIFVNPGKKFVPKFNEQMIALCRKYQQETVLIRTDKGFELFDSDGVSRVTMNKLNPNKIGMFYTQLRDKKKRTFVFEGIRLAPSKGSILLDNIRKGLPVSF